MMAIAYMTICNFDCIFIIVALMTENNNLKDHMEQEVSKRTQAQNDLKNHLQEIHLARNTEKHNSKVWRILTNTISHLIF